MKKMFVAIAFLFTCLSVYAASNSIPLTVRYNWFSNPPPSVIAIIDYTGTYQGNSVTRKITVENLKEPTERDMLVSGIDRVYKIEVVVFRGDNREKLCENEKNFSEGVNFSTVNIGDRSTGMCFLEINE